MQTEPRRHRYRGWRQSEPLVSLAKSAAADIASLWDRTNRLEADVDGFGPDLDKVLKEYVAKIQHYRYQLQWRLRREG